MYPFELQMDGVTTSPKCGCADRSEWDVIAVATATCASRDIRSEGPRQPGVLPADGGEGSGSDGLERTQARPSTSSRDLLPREPVAATRATIPTDLQEVDA